MKRRFLLPVVTGLMSLFMMMAVSTFAQEKKHTPEEHAKMQTDKMKTGVALSDDQYTKVYDVNLSFANKMKDLKKEDLSKEEKMKSFRNLRQEKNTALSAILSKDQMEKYRSLLKEQHKGMRKHHYEGKTGQS